MLNMRNMNYILIGTAILVACGVILYFAKNKRKAIPISSLLPLGKHEKKQVVGILPFDDLLAWFKSFELSKDVDVPFVVKARALKDIVIDIPLLDGKEYLILGIYDEQKDSIKKSILIECDGYDSKLKDVLGDEAIVTLR